MTNADRAAGLDRKKVAALVVVFGVALAGGAVGYTAWDRSRAGTAVVIADEKQAKAELLAVTPDDQREMETALGDYVDAYNRRDVPALIAVTAPGGMKHDSWTSAQPHILEYNLSRWDTVEGPMRVVGVQEVHYEIPGWRAVAKVDISTEKRGLQPEQRWVFRKVDGQWKVW